MTVPSDDIDREIAALSQRVARHLRVVEAPDRGHDDEWAAEARGIAVGFQRVGAMATRAAHHLAEANAARKASHAALGEQRRAGEPTGAREWSLAALVEQRRLGEDGPDGYLITDADGTIHEANAAIA